MLKYYAKNIRLKLVKMNDNSNNKGCICGLLQITVSSSIPYMQICYKTSLTSLQNPLKAAFLPSSSGFCSLVGRDNLYFLQPTVIKDKHPPNISLKLHRLENCSFPLPPALFSCMMNLGMFCWKWARDYATYRYACWKQFNELKIITDCSWPFVYINHISLYFWHALMIIRVRLKESDWRVQYLLFGLYYLQFQCAIYRGLWSPSRKSHSDE